MPFNKASYIKTSPDYKNSYNNYINSFANKNFIVLNQLYYKEDKNFGDPSHLFLGSKEVTFELLELFKNKVY